MAQRPQHSSQAQLSLDEALQRLSAAANDRDATPFDHAGAISETLDGLPLSWEERIQVIGGAFVLEALRPLWDACGGSADDAHALLRSRDPELAHAVESLAPMLYGRHTAAQEGVAAVDEVQRLIESSP